MGSLNGNLGSSEEDLTRAVGTRHGMREWSSWSREFARPSVPGVLSATDNRPRALHPDVVRGGVVERLQAANPRTGSERRVLQDLDGRREVVDELDGRRARTDVIQP